MLFNKKGTTKKNKTKPTIKPVLNISNAWLLWGCQVLNIALISIEMSAWMLSVIALCLVWQVALLKNRKLINRCPKNEEKHQTNMLLSKKNANLKANSHLVSPSLLAFFAVLGCIAIIISAKGLGLLSSMVHLLCFSYTLKAFELKKRVDFYQLWLLGIFVLAAALIFRQDLLFTVFSLVVLIINFSVLLQFFTVEQGNQDDYESSRKASTHASNLVPINVIKTTTMLVCQSMILAVVLFLVFPRLTPFWQIPLANSAKTGLSDTVKPGDIANLARSTELAFRVDFSGSQIPRYSKLYWRSMTLENYDGKEWSRAKRKRAKQQKQELVTGSGILNITSKEITYQVIAEPSFQKYLFALAPATSKQNNVKQISDYTWQTKKPITQTSHYTFTSYLTEPLELELSTSSSELNLSYPTDSNPKLEALAKQLNEDYKNVEERSQVILNMISQQKFFYTLQPPLLIDNSLDQFFFSTKSGFCVHYASVYTFLMRASGVPSRVVTGYLGGEYNSKSGNDENKQGHLSIYQYDAHAWSEIWIEGKGWLRVDPTGSVDPQRVNSGWSEQLLQQQSSLNNDLISLHRFKHLAWINTLRLQFDALDYQWTRLVLGYSAKKQYDFLKKMFGTMLSWKFALIITASLIFSFGFLILIFKWRDRARVDTSKLSPWLICYQKALSLLAKRGLEKEPTITVKEFAQEVRQKHPKLAIHFTRLTSSYSRLTYQEISLKEQQRLLIKMKGQYIDFARAIKSVKLHKSQK